MNEIVKAAVVGAGTMGSGIASHLSNAGIPVVLLDIVPQGARERSMIAQGAVERLLDSSPPAFMDKSSAELITPGNIEDHLEWIADADWIAEAVVERLDVKRALYRAMDAVRKPGSCVSSNTSTIPLAMLTEGMPAAFQADFCITHFFNPVRYMRLLEIVAGPRTRADVVEKLTRFCDIELGKGVVSCKDSPGFLGNRVGVYALQVGMIAAREFGLSVEEADAIMGRPMGIPKTGVFGLYDLIGLDLMLDVATSLAGALPPTDDFQGVAGGLAIIPALVAGGYTGNKGLGGFYRTRAAGGASILETVDLKSGEYCTATRPQLEAARVGETAGLRALVERDDKYGRFAWHVLSRTLRYAAELIPGTSDSPVPVDEAMKLGYGWLRGPFEIIDELGAAWFAGKLASEGAAVPAIVKAAGAGAFYRAENNRLQHLTLGGGYAPVERAPGVLRLTDITRTRPDIVHNEAASLWDIGEGVACVEFHSKANALGPASMNLIDEALGIVQRDFEALVIHNDAPHFSVGFNLDFVLGAVRRKAWTEIDAALLAFQSTCLAMKYAPFPVISAPAGMSLGGGCEVLMHCDALQAHSNTVMGLVETLVGLVPSGGGCKELLVRWSGNGNDLDAALASAMETFRIIGMAKTGTSLVESARLRYFLQRDRKSMNRDRLLVRSRAFAKELATQYSPPEKPRFVALGTSGIRAMEELLETLRAKGIATPHDLVVGAGLARVLCGGDRAAGEALDETQMCALERETFIALVKSPATQARIEHMLAQGKPLRN